MSSPTTAAPPGPLPRSFKGLPLDGLAALAVLYALWGSTYLGIKFALQSFPPFMLGGTRFPIAGALMLVFLLARGARRPTRRQILHCVIYGILLIGLGNGMLAVAEQYVSSGMASAVLAGTPMVIAILSGLFGKWPTPLEWVGITVGLFGLVIINLDSGLSASFIGIAALIVSLLTWAVGSVLARERLDLPGGGMTTAIELFSGGLLQTGISLALGEQLKPLTGQAIGGWVFLLAASIVGFTAYTIVLRRLPPVLGSSFAYVNPVVAIGLGIFLAGESISALAAAGVAVTLIGVVFITLAQARNSP
jgi:drug/metabolite transporter (DMT)-like permease